MTVDPLEQDYKAILEQVKLLKKQFGSDPNQLKQLLALELQFVSQFKQLRGVTLSFEQKYAPLIQAVKDFKTQFEHTYDIQIPQTYYDLLEAQIQQSITDESSNSYKTSLRELSAQLSYYIDEIDVKIRLLQFGAQHYQFDDFKKAIQRIIFQVNAVYREIGLNNLTTIFNIVSKLIPPPLVLVSELYSQMGGSSNRQVHAEFITLESMLTRLYFSLANFITEQYEEFKTNVGKTKISFQDAEDLQKLLLNICNSVPTNFRTQTWTTLINNIKSLNLKKLKS